MTKHDDIADMLRARLRELANQVAELDSELQELLPADFEEQATDLETQDAMAALENVKRREIQEIRNALERISAGTYGTCVECGDAIAPKRLAAMPTASKCRD